MRSKQLGWTRGIAARVLVCLCVALAVDGCGDDDEVEHWEESGGTGAGDGGSRAGNHAGNHAGSGGRRDANTPSHDDADAGVAGSGGAAAGSGGATANAGTGASGSEKPLYAATFDVYTADSTNSYLSVFDSLDVEALDPKKSREFAGGHASMQAYNGWLFVGEPTNPVVHRFTVTSTGELEDEKKVSLVAFGQEEANIDDWYLSFISPTKAYLFTYKEGATVILNPTTMEINRAT